MKTQKKNPGKPRLNMVGAKPGQGKVVVQGGKMSSGNKGTRGNKGVKQRPGVHTRAVAAWAAGLAGMTVEVSQAGDVHIPAALFNAAGLQSKSYVVQFVENGILIVPVSELVEDYTPERKAEFMLNNSVDEADYVTALKAVRAMGFDPKKINHRRPNAVGA